MTQNEQYLNLVKMLQKELETKCALEAEIKSAGVVAIQSVKKLSNFINNQIL